MRARRGITHDANSTTGNAVRSEDSGTTVELTIVTENNLKNVEQVDENANG